MDTGKINVIITTEMGIVGKVPEDYPNMRVEFAWARALDAIFVPLLSLNNYLSNAETLANTIILFILPNGSRRYDHYPLEIKKQYACKIGVIQEGPITIYQDWSVTEQLNNFHTLENVDALCVHNVADKLYLKNLLNIDVNKIHIFQTIINDRILKKVVPLPMEKRRGIILSGNFSSWYGGMMAYKLVRKMFPDEKIYMPGSGRVTRDEHIFKDITILPWYSWEDWMEMLNQFKIGINLMSTRAAGTFSLNCALLGIPCIGFSDLDTQLLTQLDTLTFDKENLQPIHPKYPKIHEVLYTLYNDKNVYKMAQGYGLQISKQYSIENKKEYFQNIMKKILKGGPQ